MKHWPGSRRCSTTEVDQILKHCRTTFEEYFIKHGRLCEAVIAKSCPFLEKKQIILVRPEMETANSDRQLASAIFNKGFLCRVAQVAADKDRLAKEKADNAILRSEGIHARKELAATKKSARLTELLSHNQGIQQLNVGDLRLLATHYKVIYS